jgi:hypothetical protein
MKVKTNSSPSTESPSSDALVASAQTDGYFSIPSVVRRESTYWNFQPHSAVDSVWGETLAATSTQVLREWIDDEAASHQSRTGDVA